MRDCSHTSRLHKTIQTTRPVTPGHACLMAFLCTHTSHHFPSFCYFLSFYQSLNRLKQYRYNKYNVNLYFFLHFLASSFFPFLSFLSCLQLIFGHRERILTLHTASYPPSTVLHIVHSRYRRKWRQESINIFMYVMVYPFLPFSLLHSQFGAQEGKRIVWTWKARNSSGLLDTCLCWSRDMAG